MRTFLIFVQKEFFHIFRDLRSMLILLAMPIIQIILFGFAISTEIRDSRVVVFDMSKDAETQRVIERLAASEYFSIVGSVGSVAEIDRLFRNNKIDMVLAFSDDFAGNTGRGGGASVQLLTDATDPNTATMVSNYAQAIIGSEYLESKPINDTVRLLYNPTMKSAYNFVPGVMGLILMLICAMMTSISIVREKERGTMEVLLVSPIHPLIIIVAKVIPYLVLSMVNLTSILLLSVFVLDVPISGGLLSLVLFSFVFVVVALSLGLLISTIAKTQVVAMILSGMVLLMPTVLLSGMMFPVENMPVPLQVFSSIIPARWYIEGVRKLMIQGVELKYAFKELIILCVMAVVLITVSLKKFKTRL